MLDPVCQLFEDDRVVMELHHAWQASRNYTTLLDHLYDPDPDTRELTLTLLQSMSETLSNALKLCRLHDIVH